MAMAAPVKRVQMEEKSMPAPADATTAIAPRSPGQSPLHKAVGSPKEKLVDDASRSAPQSPQTPPLAGHKEGHTQISPGERGSNLKAEAYSDAHVKRVEAEAQAYIDSEVRKAEAHAEKMKAVADKSKIGEEARAIETLKKEEKRAEEVVHAAILKADKLIAQAKEKCALIKANAKDASEKHIAEATAAAERTQAELEESKKKEQADICVRAEQMKIAGEVPGPPKKGIGHKIKEKVVGH